MKIFVKVFFIFLACAFAYLGLAPREYNLNNRTIHADEAEQTYTFYELFAAGKYAYNPNGPHGPILYYYPLLFLQKDKVNSFDVKDLRRTLLPIFFASAAMVFLAGLNSKNKNKLEENENRNAFKKYLGASFGVLFLSISSLSQIYSTYFVQEVFFALFSLFCALSFYIFLRKPNLLNAAFLGLAIGFLQITKETSVFIFASAFFSALLIFLLKNKNEENQILEKFKKIKKIDFLKMFFLFFAFAFAIYACFYSSFGKNWHGLYDGFATYYQHFWGKSVSLAHSKSFFYYFELLYVQKSDYMRFGEIGILAFAIFGGISAFVRRNDFIKYIGLYALINLLILSCISYKTPWLLLSVIYALCVLAGYGVSELLFVKAKKIWLTVLLKIAAVALLILTINFQYKLSLNASAKFTSDPRNPFLYVHTVKDEENLVRRVRECSKIVGTDMKVLIATLNSPWPMPWQFFRYADMNIVREIRSIDNLNEYTIVIFDSNFDVLLKSKFDEKIWLEEYVGLREGLLLRVFTKRDVFEKSIQ